MVISSERNDVSDAFNLCVLKYLYIHIHIQRNRREIKCYVLIFNLLKIGVTIISSR